jgi:hypothetical protein
VYNPAQVRDQVGKWASGGGREAAKQKILVAHARVIGHEMKIKAIVDRMKAHANTTSHLR